MHSFECVWCLLAYLVDLGVDHQVQVLVNSPCAVDISVGAIRAAASVAVDPLQPVLGTVASDEILKIIGGRDALGVGGTKEVVLDGICIVAVRSG